MEIPLEVRVHRMTTQHGDTLSAVIKRLRDDSITSLVCTGPAQTDLREHHYHVLRALDMLSGELQNLSEAGAALVSQPYDSNSATRD